MSLKIANEIVDLQGISKKIEFIVKCPYCERKEARLNVKKGKWECVCGKKGTEEELLRLVQEDYFDDHQEAYWETRNNTGVCK